MNLNRSGRNSLVRCFAYVAALLCAVGATAQQPAPDDLMELSVEDLMRIKVESVYGASKFSQKVTDAPASVTIVTADEMRRYGYRTLGELLQGVPGFYVTYDRNYTYTALRGFGRTGDYNSRILLLIDGHRLNDNIYDQALLGNEFPVSLDVVERVEIIHGPSSALYGNNAFLAVIDVITRKGAATNSRVSLTGGSHRAGTVEAVFSSSLGLDKSVLVSASLHSSRGNAELYYPAFNSPETNNGMAVRADYERYRHLLGTLTWRHWRLQGVHSSRKKGIPTASFETVFNDSRAWSVDRREFLDFSYARLFPKDWDVAARIYTDRYVYFADYPYDYSGGLDDVVLNHDRSDGIWWGEEVKITKPLRRHRISVGNEFRHNIRQEQQNFDREPFLSYLDDRRRSTVWAFYAQDEISVASRLLVTLGIRHDSDSAFGGSTNPRVALIYNPPTKTTLKLLYGSAFRAPNAYELYYIHPESGARNLNLAPETIRTVEVAVEQYLGGSYRLGGRVFRNRIADLIGQVDIGDGLLQFQNRDSVRAIGAELVMEYKLARGIGGHVNYAYQSSTAGSANQDAADHAPGHLLNARVQLPVFASRLHAALDFHYVGSRRTLRGERADAFGLLNLVLTNETVAKSFEISGAIYNLLGARYGYAGGAEHTQNVIEQDGRTVAVEVTYRFGREQ